MPQATRHRADVRRDGTKGMLLGIQMSLWTPRPIAAEHGRVLPRLKGLGYDLVELHVAEMSDVEAGRWESAARGAGLAVVPSLVMRMGREEPASDHPTLRAAALDALRAALDRAAIFGSRMLVGPILQPPGRFTGAPASEIELERVVAVLREAGEHAGRLGMVIAVEPLNRFESYIANTLEQAGAILDRAGSPHLRLLADTHHANIEEKSVEGAFLKHIDHIGCIHISENHRGIPGEGHAAPPSLFRALRDAGYDGPITVEAFTNKHAALARRLHLWRPMFEGDEMHLAERAAKYIRRCWEGGKR